MALGVTREGGGFEKAVWENVVDTLPGGLTIDITGYTADADGNIPAGTMVAKDPATGLGKIVTIAAGVYSLPPLGYTIRTHKAETNALAEVGISGTIRKKALPAGQGTDTERATALPRITHV